MRDPNIVYNDQPLLQLDSDELIVGFLPWLLKVFSDIPVLNVLYRD
jgi:hypothetical protein